MSGQCNCLVGFHLFVPDHVNDQVPSSIEDERKLINLDKAVKYIFDRSEDTTRYTYYSLLFRKYMHD